MIRLLIVIGTGLLISCSASDKKNHLVVKTELPKELKEISGITADGSAI